MAAIDRKIGAWAHPIVNEADRPNRPASDMKSIFDSNTNELKEALNGLIDDILAGDAAQAFEEAEERENIASGDTLAVIFGKLAKFFTDAQLAVDTVRSGGQSTRYLSEDGTYTTPPAAGEAANGVRMGGDPGDVYVKVSGTDYDAEWITPGPGLVGAPRMITAEKTVAVSAWSAAGGGYTVTVPVNGMDAEACVVVGPDAGSYGAWRNAGIRGSSQAEGEITLFADCVPGTSVTVDLFAVWNPPADAGEPRAL